MEKIDILEPDCFYHIFNRGNNKEDLFIEETNYYHFLRLVEEHIIKVADIYSYCLMKNHFHIEIKIKSKTAISPNHSENIHQPFSNLFNAYTKAYNKKYGREGSLFRVRFKRERIDSEDYLRNVIIYTHLNPVKHKFENDFKLYKYSSYQSLLCTKSTLLKRGEVLDLFGGTENFIYIHNEILRKGNYEEIE